MNNLRTIIRIVSIYILFSLLWIYSSDQLLLLLDSRYNLPIEVHTYKGAVFVLVTGLIFFAMLYRELKRRETDWREHMAEKERLLEQLNQKNQDLLEAYDKTIMGWSRVLEMRNRELKDHSRRVTDLTVRLAEYLGVREPDLADLRRGAMLHDIGKMAIPDSIMLKDSGLTEDERAVIRRHPLFGFEMLSEIEYLRPAMDLLLSHHEKYNGEGYPFGLAGDQIPLSGRIFAVVDVWDALISDRVYHEAMSPEAAAEVLRAEAGIHFDPVIVSAFLRMMEEDGAIAPAKESA